MRMDVEGVFSKVFKIEAPLPAVFAFLTDYNYVLPRMPEVDKVVQLSDDHYRMYYSADVVAGFKMHTVFDIRPEPTANRLLKLISLPIPADDLKNIQSTMHEPVHTGNFTAIAHFTQNGSHCDVTYKAQLKVEVEVPEFLKLLPKFVLNKMSGGIMNFKMGSVGDGMAKIFPAEYINWSRDHEEEVRQITGTLS